MQSSACNYAKKKVCENKYIFRLNIIIRFMFTTIFDICTMFLIRNCLSKNVSPGEFIHNCKLLPCLKIADLDSR